MAVQASTIEKDCIGLIAVRCGVSITIGALFVVVMFWGPL